MQKAGCAKGKCSQLQQRLLEIWKINEYDQIKVYVMYKAMYMQFYINEVHYLTSFLLSKIHNNQNIVMTQMKIPNL